MPDYTTMVVVISTTMVVDDAWELFRGAPEPLGHDPYSIWPAGPDDPDAGVLRLRPWRIRVATMETLLGRSKPLVWARRPVSSRVGRADRRAEPPRVGSGRG